MSCGNGDAADLGVHHHWWDNIGKSRQVNESGARVELPDLGSSGISDQYPRGGFRAMPIRMAVMAYYLKLLGLARDGLPET
jgi:hypothetical protein